MDTLDRNKLESIERDAKRLEEIGQRIQKLKENFETLEAKALELQRQIIEKR